jgi:DNA-binding transcriptional LysR family regulator
MKRAAMDIGWIDDLIAIEEKGSLSRAAKARNVTQPAFSRRIAAIEHWFGADIVNRANRPLRLTPEMVALMPTLHEMAATLRHLRSELQASQGDTSKVVVAAQHSLLTSFLPRKLTEAQGQDRLLMKLQSAYPEDGVALLLTKQVDILVAYETARRPLFGQVPDLEREQIATDRFIPFTADRSLRDALRALSPEDNMRVPVITFPRQNFFGRVLWEDIAKSLPRNIHLDPLIESGLSTGVIQFVLAGTGVAWLPSAIAAPHVEQDDLFQLDDVLPTEELFAYCFRVQRSHSKGVRLVWDLLTEKSSL